MEGFWRAFRGFRVRLVRDFEWNGFMGFVGLGIGFTGLRV